MSFWCKASQNVRKPVLDPTKWKPKSSLTNFRYWWWGWLTIWGPQSPAFSFGLPRLPFLSVLPFEVVGNRPRRIWITFFSTKSWCKRTGWPRWFAKSSKHFCYECLAFTQRLKRTHSFEVQRFKGKGVKLSILLRTWSGDLEKRTLWGSGQSVHRMAVRLCAFLPRFPSHDKLQWASGILGAC